MLVKDPYLQEIRSSLSGDLHLTTEAPLLCELRLYVYNLKKFFVWMPYCYSKRTTNHTKMKVKGFWKSCHHAFFQILNCDQRCCTVATLCSVVLLLIEGHWKYKLVVACHGITPLPRVVKIGQLVQKSTQGSYSVEMLLTFLLSFLFFLSFL